MGWDPGGGVGGSEELHLGLTYLTMLAGRWIPAQAGGDPRVGSQGHRWGLRRVQSSGPSQGCPLESLGERPTRAVVFKPSCIILKPRLGSLDQEPEEKGPGLS